MDIIEFRILGKPMETNLAKTLAALLKKAGAEARYAWLRFSLSYYNNAAKFEMSKGLSIL